ncbi:hypothetical protein AAFF_G00279000 [Aldrovandia affinis]|uniref:Uncharacterized protein n=1 Tax=Aldrovandia affinis TaxID=143900 RepID=A0AAD7SRL8_9TELE|nr:hypothetical protein AAFF_G00279000 [Aldrovandia affinis]
MCIIGPPLVTHLLFDVGVALGLLRCRGDHRSGKEPSSVQRITSPCPADTAQTCPVSTEVNRSVSLLL